MKERALYAVKVNKNNDLMTLKLAQKHISGANKSFQMKEGHFAAKTKEIPKHHDKVIKPRKFFC